MDPNYYLIIVLILLAGVISNGVGASLPKTNVWRGPSMIGGCGLVALGWILLILGPYIR